MKLTGWAYVLGTVSGAAMTAIMLALGVLSPPNAEKPRVTVAVCAALIISTWVMIWVIGERTKIGP